MTVKAVVETPKPAREPVRVEILRAMESLDLTLQERDSLRIRCDKQEHELIDVRARLDGATAALRVSEISRDIYMESSTEAIARLDVFARQLRDIGVAVAEALIDARNAPFRPRTAQEPLEVDPADQARLESLAIKLAPEVSA